MGRGDLSESIQSGGSLDDMLDDAEGGAVVLPSATDQTAWMKLASKGKEYIDKIMASADPKVAIGEHLMDESAMLCIVAAYRWDLPWMTFKLQALSSKKGMGKFIDTFTSNLRRIAKDQSDKLAKEIHNEIGAKRAATLAKMFGIDIPPGLKTPTGYEISADGVFSIRNYKGEEELTQVCPAPIFITKRLVEHRSSEAQMELMWREDQKWTRKTLSRGEVYDTRGLSALSLHGAPISAVNVTDVMRFLQKFEADNMSAIPKEDMTCSMGWQDDSYSSFVAGNATILQPGSDKKLSMMQKGGLESFCDEWRSKGTIEGWFHMMRKVEDFWAPYACVYASVASILLPMVDVANHMYEFAGETSGGKTLTLRFGASVWGNPEKDCGILTSWDASKAGFQHIAAFSGNLPIFCDDTAETARKSPELFAKIIYQHSSGQGSVRGTADDKLRTRKKWRSILISTGETPAHTLTNDPGTRARVVSFMGHPFGRSRNQAELDRKKHLLADVDEMLRTNYGLFGPLIVKKIVETPFFCDDIRKVYAHYSEKYRGQSDSGVLGRISAYVSLLETARDLCVSVGLPVPNVDVMASVWEAAKKTALDADQGRAAMEQFLDFCVAGEARFWGHHREVQGEPVQPSGGWIGAWERAEKVTLADNGIYILPSILNEFLKIKGFFPAAILDIWMERGGENPWISRSRKTGGPLTTEVYINGTPRPCIKVRPGVLQEKEGV